MQIIYMSCKVFFVVFFLNIQELYAPQMTGDGDPVVMSQPQDRE